jgi:hypothetical protein
VGDGAAGDCCADREIGCGCHGVGVVDP